MAIVTQPARTPSPPAQAKPSLTAIPGDQRIVIRNLSWELYDRLSDAVGERQHIYLAYDGRDLELMTKGWTHEDYKELFSRFVTFVTSELRIRSRPAGETTWKRPEIKRGLEADQRFYRWIVQEDSNDELAWEDRLREWARTELSPRRRT